MSHSTESLFEFEFGGKSYKKYSASKESIESKYSANDSKNGHKTTQRKDSGYSLNGHLYHPHAALPSPISSPNDANNISIMAQYRNKPNIYIVDNTPSPCSPKSPLSLSQSKSEQFDYLYCDRPNTAKSDGSGSRSSFGGKRQHKKHKKGNPFARDKRDRDRIRKNNSDDYIESVQPHRNRHDRNNKDRDRKNRNNNNRSKNPFSMNRRQNTASPKKYGHRNNNNPFCKDNDNTTNDHRTYSEENLNEMIKPKLEQRTQSNTIKTARDSINGLAKRIGSRSIKKREKSYKERKIHKIKDNHNHNHTNSKHKHRKTLSDVGVIANKLNFGSSTTQKLKDRVTSSKKKYYKSRTKSPRISNEKTRDKDKNKSRNSKKLKKKHKQKRIAADDGKINNNKNRNKIKKLKRINPKKLKKRRKSNNDSDQLSMLYEANVGLIRNSRY